MALGSKGTDDRNPSQRKRILAGHRGHPQIIEMRQIRKLILSINPIPCPSIPAVSEELEIRDKKHSGNDGRRLSYQEGNRRERRIAIWRITRMRTLQDQFNALLQSLGEQYNTRIGH
jgi:hypothetical protein